MARFILTIIGAAFFLQANAQSFEGKIHFVKQSVNDTIHYNYLVKDKMMRVDELDNSGNPLQSLLIDLEIKSMTAIHPARKMYMPFPVNPMKVEDKTCFKIKKTSKSKDFFGYNCKYWTVEHLTDSIFIEYWVADDEFDFFVDFLMTSNTADKSASYYLQFADIKGKFPMLSVEKDFSGKEKLKLEVLDIEEKTMDPSLFVIPDDYISFQR